MLGVNYEILEIYGVVSEEIVIEMVKGVMKLMNFDCVVVILGIVGFIGGIFDKLVGIIWIVVGCKDKVIILKLEGDEGRNKNIVNVI